MLVIFHGSLLCPELPFRPVKTGLSTTFGPHHDLRRFICESDAKTTQHMQINDAISECHCFLVSLVSIMGFDTNT